MVLRRIKYALLLFVCCLACKHKPNLITGGDYPPHVANILLGKCATSGCHNDISFSAAGGLNLSSWNKLFLGAGTGAIVIPYSPNFSSLCYFTNTDTNLGVTLEPTMPINQAPLSRAEYFILRDWIAAGAPDIDGRVRFSEGSSRSKIYVTNRLCDVVTVIDAASLLQMRYVDVGQSTDKEFPYCIKVSPDKKYWYVSFLAQSGVVQQFSAVDDRYIGNITLGEGSWTSFVITSDSRYAYFVDNSSPGKIAYVDLSSGLVIATYFFNGKLIYPSGIAINEKQHKLYVGATLGNFIYSINIADPLSPVITQVPIDGSSDIKYQTTLDPAEVLADQSGSKCYIACQRSNEIRVMDMAADSLVGKIELGTLPAFMVQASGKLFVSCPDDKKTFPGNRGSVAVIDIEQGLVAKMVNTGYQPFGLAIDEYNNAVAVVNANISSEGPESHHVSGCGEKNGNVTFIDMSTLELVRGKKLEVAVFPFGAAAR